MCQNSRTSQDVPGILFFVVVVAVVVEVIHTLDFDNHGIDSSSVPKFGVYHSDHDEPHLLVSNVKQRSVRQIDVEFLFGVSRLRRIDMQDRYAWSCDDPCLDDNHFYV